MPRGLQVIPKENLRKGNVYYMYCQIRVHTLPLEPRADLPECHNGVLNGLKKTCMKNSFANF